MTKYKHVNKGNGTITIVDDNGMHYILHPGEYRYLDKKYTKFEPYGIICVTTEQKKSIEEKPMKNKKIKESELNDSTNN